MIKVKDKKNSKENKIYEAVLSLLYEGKDINNIKVIDISNEAGIGKGTVYEYFSSKEEAIAKALLFDLENKKEEINKIIENSSSFEIMLYNLFKWVDSNMKFDTLLLHLLKMDLKTREISSKFAELNSSQCICVDFSKAIVEKIVDRAFTEKIANSKITKEECFYSINSQIAGYILYCYRIKNHSEIKKGAKEIQNITYKNIIRCISE